MSDVEKLAAWDRKRAADFREDIAWAETRHDLSARHQALARVSAYTEVAYVAAELAAGRDITGVTA